MLDDVPFDISVTHSVVFECSSPYTFRTIHSEQAPTFLISIAVMDEFESINHCNIL